MALVTGCLSPNARIPPKKDTEARIPYIYIAPLQKVLGQICGIHGKAKAANEALDAKNFFPLQKRHPRQIGFNFLASMAIKTSNKNRQKRQIWPSTFSLAEIMASNSTIRKESNVEFI